MTELVEVRVPDMGSFKDVTVIDLLVKVGDTVELETPLATLETEKATMDVPSPVVGVIEALHIAKGAVVNTGDRVASVRAVAGAAKAAVAETATEQQAAAQQSAPTPVATPAAAPAVVVAPPPAPVSAPSAAARAPQRSDLPLIDEAGFSRAYAGPSVRKLARELGVNLAQVTGSGVKGRITHDDVKAWVKKVLSGALASAGPVVALPRVPVVDFAAFGPVEVKPLSRVQKISGARLHAAWYNLPHVTQFDAADITALEETRGQLKEQAVKRGIKLTPLAFVVRACVKALAAFPKFNASLDESGQNLVYKKYMHIGFAADTPNGLLVPVIRDADRCDIYEIARQLGELSERARNGKLSGADMQGGSFTISSLGGIGGTAFTPIINAPEVAILGVSRSSQQPVFQGGAFVPRLMLPLSLSYDHRVIDGADAARFTTFLAKTLAEPQGLLEAVP